MMALQFGTGNFKNTQLQILCVSCYERILDRLYGIFRDAVGRNNVNLLRYQCESAPDFAVRCAFLRVR